MTVACLSIAICGLFVVSRPFAGVRGAVCEKTRGRSRSWANGSYAALRRQASYTSRILEVTRRDEVEVYLRTM